MHLLIVSATESEISLLLGATKAVLVQDNLFHANYGNYEIRFLITGIGSIGMASNLASYLAHNKPDLVINAGICGSCDDSLPVGSFVQVITDVLADLTFSNGDNIALANNKWNALAPGCRVLKNDFILPYEIAQPVKGITVNKASASFDEAKMRRQMFTADVESMEGAAFFYAAQASKVNCLQIRTISNKAGDSTRESWNMSLALSILSDRLVSILDQNIL